MAARGLRSLFGKFYGETASYAIGGAVQPALAPAVRQFSQVANATLPNEIHSPLELAQMVVQGVLDEQAAAGEAAKAGISGDAFHQLVRVAGEPPGPQQLLELWDRGDIDEGDVDRGLLQSRLKPEWVDLFKRLRTRPASAAAAVNAVIKERIPETRGLAIAAENGIDAETFRMLVDEGGRPISITQGLQLLRRRKITQARFREIVARSDVKTEFTADLLGLQENLPSLAQMRAIIGTGAIADDVARTTLQHLGYSDSIVEGIIAAGHGVKLEGAKQLTQSAILSAYQSRQIEHADAQSMLAGLGYDANDAAVLLAYADFQRQHAYRTAVIGVVKARYLAHDIDESTASSMLDKIGMPPAERDDYLALWTFDIQANPHLLTLAQLNAAVKQGIYSAAQYRAYLPRLGYVEPEISVLAALYAGG